MFEQCGNSKWQLGSVDVGCSWTDGEVRIAGCRARDILSHSEKDCGEGGVLVAGSGWVARGCGCSELGWHDGDRNPDGARTQGSKRAGVLEGERNGQPERATKGLGHGERGLFYKLAGGSDVVR